MKTDNFVKVLLVLILLALVANLMMSSNLKPVVRDVIAPAAQASTAMAVEPGMVVVTADATGRTIYTWQIDDTFLPRYVGRDTARGPDRPVAPEARSESRMEPEGGADARATAGESSGVRAGHTER